MISKKVVDTWKISVIFIGYPKGSNHKYLDCVDGFSHPSSTRLGHSIGLLQPPHDLNTITLTSIHCRP